MSGKKDPIWEHYDRELRGFQKDAQDFAARHKAEAAALGLGGRGAADPHVQRMIEAFALLTARVRAKLDDDFPELIDATLGVLYPHLLAPVPSMGVVQFLPLPGAAGLEQGLPVASGAFLETKDTGALPARCKYRTTYPVRLWPIELADAQLLPPPFPPAWKPVPQGALPGGARYHAVLRLSLRTTGPVGFGELPLSALRLYLWGDNVLTAALHELLLNNVLGVSYRNDGDANARHVLLNENAPFRPVGLEADEGLFQYPPQSFPGFRLLTEFFAYREKFLFLDLVGWDEARRADALKGKSVEILIYLNRTLAGRLDQDVNVDNFRLGATPIVNLFEQKTEAIPLTRRRYDYPIVPDVHAPAGYEVVQVLDVRHADPVTGEQVVYEPFYAYRHGERGRAFWYARRRTATASGESAPATDVDLHFVDLNFDPALPSDPTVVVTTLCCNRNLPRVLREAGEHLAFEPQQALPANVRCLRPVTPTLRPAPGRGAYWRLVSLLNLNHLSLGGELGLQAFKEYLELHNFADPDADTELAKVNQQVVEGILDLTAQRSVELLQGAGGVTGFARGMEVELELDDEKFTGLGSFIFAGVLDRFLAHHASINSYTRLVHRTRQGGLVKRWPPRSGSRELI